MSKPAVLVLAFNRSSLTKDLLKQLIACDCDIYISIDGARPHNDRDFDEISEILKYVDELGKSGKTIKVNLLKRNYGCRQAIISGIDWFFQNTDEGIILEDDCHLLDGAISYFARGLDFYRNNKTIGMISGTLSLDCSIGCEFTCYAYNIWGWATWADRWALNLPVAELRLKLASMRAQYPLYYPNLKFSLDVAEQVDTWDVQWCISLLTRNLKCVYPEKNLITNVGTYSSRNDSIKTTNLNFKKNSSIALKSPADFERAIYALHKPNLAKRMIAALGLYGLTRTLVKKVFP